MYHGSLSVVKNAFLSSGSSCEYVTPFFDHDGLKKQDIEIKWPSVP